jgi:hypothetical protein
MRHIATGISNQPVCCKNGKAANLYNLFACNRLKDLEVYCDECLQRIMCEIKIRMKMNRENK